MRKMKDSGIAWIGEIPTEWRIVKTSRLFEIQLGKMLQPQQENESDTLEHYLCAANLGGNVLKLDEIKEMWFSVDEKTKYDVKKGDLLVVEGGDIASCDVVRQDVNGLYIQNALHRVRSKNNNDIRILRYLLITAKEQGYIELLCNKATIAHFTKEKFGNMPFVLAPLNEQRRIAAFLDGKCARMDSIIEKTRASIDEYKKLKQSIITEAVTKGIRPGRKMKDSGIDWIGEIPEEWKVKRLRYIGKCQNGISKGGEYFGTGFPFVSYSDVYKNMELPVRVQGLVESTIAERKLYSVKRGDIFFTRTSETIEEIGFTAICKETIKDATFAGFLIRVRPFDDNLDVGFSKYYFRSDIHRQFFVKEMNLVIRASLGQELLKKLPVLLPPLPEQQEIAAYLDAKTAAIDRLIAKKEQLVTEMQSCKKSLIYEYVTGKKEVQN